MKNPTKEALEQDLRERVIWVVNDFAATAGKYAYLEERTGITARKWKNMCNRVIQPSPEMMMELAKVRPYLATWMLTGQAFPVQVSPTSSETWESDFLEKLMAWNEFEKNHKDRPGKRADNGDLAEAVLMLRRFDFVDKNGTEKDQG